MPQEAESSAQPPDADADEARAPLLSGAVTVGGLTMTSRVLGAARDILFARFFYGGALDAFAIAWMIPNLSRRLLGEGALSSAFIPVFVEKVETGDRPGALRLARNAATLLIITLGALAAAGVVLALLLGLGRGPGDRFGNTMRLLAVTLPYMVLVCLAALYMAVLNTFRRFAAPAVGPALLNVCFILGAWLFRDYFGETPAEQVLVLALAALVGGALQIAVQLPGARREGFASPFTRPRLDPETRRVLAALGGAVLGLAVFQVNVLVDQILAATLIPGEGSVGILFLSARLIQLPLGVFGVAIAVAALPELARAAARNDSRGLVATLAGAIRAALFVTIPWALFTMSVAVTFIYARFYQDTAKLQPSMVEWLR